MALNFVTFNQDHSHLAVGTSSGFRVYKTDPFAKAHETHDGDVSRLEMLFSTSLLALVMSPRRLVITNSKRNSTICELTFPSTVLGVRLNRKRLVAVLEDQIYIYDISNMKLIHTINTSPNPHGVCALAPTSEHCYLAYPHPQAPAPSSFAPPSHVPPTSAHLGQQSGHVLLFDAINLQAANIIEAHRTPLSSLAMNSDGTRLATASDKGTIIRVFSVPGAHKLFQFRRGTMPARILSMSFNSTSTLLCVSSETDTIHVFRLAASGSGGAGGGDGSSTTSPARGVSPAHRRTSSSFSSQGRRASGVSDDADEDDQLDADAREADDIAVRKHNGSFAGMIRRTSQTVGKSFAATVGGYLPSAVTEMLEPARDFAWIKTPKTSGAGNVKSVVALSNTSPQVMVVTSEGNFFVFNIDLEMGGEGTLVRQHSVMESKERPTRFVSEE